jgi:hypothetical protein
MLGPAKYLAKLVASLGNLVLKYYYGGGNYGKISPVNCRR